MARGEPLLVWGEYDEDALRVRSLGRPRRRARRAVLDRRDRPVLFRLWSTGDDQVVAVCNGHDCALYIVGSQLGYGTSVGDPTRQGTFELVDHDVGEVSIPWADCIPWRVARPALVRFAEYGELGEQVMLDGSIQSGFLMLGDYDRAAELATRRTPVPDPAQTSLPRKAPCGAWAERLLGGLIDLHLIEVDHSILVGITARVAMLLQQFGDDAQRLRRDRAEADEGARARARRRRAVRDRGRSADRAAPHAGSTDAAGGDAVSMKRLVLLLAVAACGDNLAPSGSFEIVGHTDLGARGMNSALAIAGDTAYVGSRIDGKGIAIVDIADPAHPAVVGEIGAPDEGLVGCRRASCARYPSRTCSSC